MSKQLPYGIHWFRRDLRIAGNPALLWNWNKHDGRVLGIFTFDKKFLSREDYSKNRFAFFLETLKDLKNQLRKTGGDLLVLDTGPEESFRALFTELQSHHKALPSFFSYNRDYEPYAVQRDHRIPTLLKSEFGIDTHSERDHLLIEPHEIQKEGKSPFYQVYSPFQRNWLKTFQKEPMLERVEIQKQGLKFLKEFEDGKADTALFTFSWKKLLSNLQHQPALQDVLDQYSKQIFSSIDIQIPQAGSYRALERAQHFHKNVLTDYTTARDIPSVAGTSQMSIFLKNGSITVAQLIAALDLTKIDTPKPTGHKESPGKYLNELIWREFYYHILSHRPEVETETFNSKYAKLPWQNKASHFKAWQDGMTGYPIVDAGMRQLKQTGWMHNRVRMIVASFMTKDLLIDYRWGENHFMKLLLDGDLAPNNGGWQWAASTGCDPQPYFRIFNPVLQSQRFDPDGIYIRHFIPELKMMDNQEVHEPWNSPRKTTYPKPIVNHAEQKAKAIALFKNVRAQASSKG